MTLSKSIQYLLKFELSSIHPGQVNSWLGLRELNAKQDCLLGAFSDQKTDQTLLFDQALCLYLVQKNCVSCKSKN